VEDAVPSHVKASCCQVLVATTAADRASKPVEVYPFEKSITVDVDLSLKFQNPAKPFPFPTISIWETGVELGLTHARTDRPPPPCVSISLRAGVVVATVTEPVPPVLNIAADVPTAPGVAHPTAPDNVPVSLYPEESLAIVPVASSKDQYPIRLPVVTNIASVVVAV
jgi:hypothetical protein